MLVNTELALCFGKGHCAEASYLKIKMVKTNFHITNKVPEPDTGLTLRAPILLENLFYGDPLTLGIPMGFLSLDAFCFENFVREGKYFACKLLQILSFIFNAI